jgi:LacI family transcriptional regulator
MPVTLKEIAKFSGVSVATVSQALNNKPVNRKTKKRVLQAAEVLRYEPSALARGLRMNKTYTIGFAFENSKQELNEAIVRCAQEKGYLVLSQQFREYDVTDERKVYRNLLARRVDGVLSWPSESGFDYATMVQDFRRHNIPVVIVDRNIPNINAPCFCCDNRKGMKMAWTHLRKLKREPIVYVDFADDISTVQERREGVRDACLEAGVRWNDKYHIKALNRGSLNQELLHLAIDITRDGGAILTATDPIAFAIMRVNQKTKIAIPKDAALIGFEDVVIWLKERVGWTTAPPLTTVRMRFDEIGRRAVEFLVDSLENKSKEKRNSIDNNKVFRIEPHLVVRESCGGKPGIYASDENGKISLIGEEEF